MKQKVALLTILFLFLTGALGGCTLSKANFPDMPYSKSNYAVLHDAGDYIINALEPDRITFCSKADETYTPVSRDPFEGDGYLQYEKIHPYGNGFFYKRENAADTEILYLDLDSFQEHEVYKQTANRTISLFGVVLWSTPAARARVMMQHKLRNYFFAENQLILVHNGYVSSFDGCKETTLFEREVQQIAYFSGVIYYTDKLGNVYMYEMDNGKTSTIEGVKAFHIKASERGLFFTNIYDDTKLYRLSAPGQQAEKISDRIPDSFFVSSNDVWIVSHSQLYYSTVDKMDFYKVSEEKIEDINILDNGETICVIVYGEKDASKKIQIIKKSQLLKTIK